ncbi:MAG: hypothetical protein PHH77_12040 [Victivallaceae bacterium]|nr:hypothetical protein [Victivallaceae bacterium]
MKRLQRGKRHIKRREKIKAAGTVFMSMGLPLDRVRNINRELRKAS